MIIISLCIRLFFPHTLSAFSVSCFFAAQYHDLQAATVSRTLEKSEKTELRRARDYGGNRFSSAHRCTNGFHPQSKPIVDSQSYAFLVTIICLSFFFLDPRILRLTFCNHANQVVCLYLLFTPQHIIKPSLWYRGE